MSQLSDRLAVLLLRLHDAGVHATADPRDITGPCVWVAVREVAPALGGTFDISADVCLVVPDGGATSAVHELGRLLDAVAVAPLSWDTPARAATVTPPGCPPMPALVIPTTL